MLTFHGIPRRTFNPGRRIVHVIAKGPVVETPCLPPKFLPHAPPIRTQLFKVAFSDGSTEMAKVIL
jgi:hypothetical protein